MLFTSLNNNIFAHTIGQAPNFKINGSYAKLFPVYSSSTDNFSLPQDTATENFLVNQNINFEIDVNALGLPEEIINKTEYSWDYGDGQKGTGIKNDHSYDKIGTYILTIYSDDKVSPKQIFESVAIDVLPDVNYKLPELKLIANGRQSNDPLIDIIRLNFSKEVIFEADISEGTAKIVSYYWDFGDKNSSTDKNTKHVYESGLIQVFPLLEIKDENGFVVDNYIQLENEKFGKNQFFQNFKNTDSSDVDKPKLSQLKFTIAVTSIIILLLYVKFKKQKKKTND